MSNYFLLVPALVLHPQGVKLVVARLPGSEASGCQAPVSLCMCLG